MSEPIIVPAVRIIVPDDGSPSDTIRQRRYRETSATAYAKASEVLGTDALNLCDFTITPEGSAFTYTVMRDPQPNDAAFRPRVRG